MNQTIQTPNQHLSTSTRRMIQEKFAQLETLLTRIQSCYIVLKKSEKPEDEVVEVEARLTVPGMDLFASSKGRTFEQAGEKVITQLKHQIGKYKARFIKKTNLAVDQFLINQN